MDVEFKQEEHMKIHPSITLVRVEEAVHRQMTTLSNPGFCIDCGKEAEGCEPDARRLTCESCGEDKVYGAQEILFRMA
jgi:hypothetical protein